MRSSATDHDPDARRAVPRLSVDRRAVVRRRAAVCALRHGGAAALAHARGFHGDDRPVPGAARAEHRQRGDPARQAVARSARRHRRVPRALRASISVGARARAALYALGRTSARVGGRNRRRRLGGRPVHRHRGEARPADRPQARGGRVDGRLLHRGGDRARAAARGDADRGDRRSVSLAQAHAVTLIELGRYFAVVVGLTFAGGYIIATPHTPDWRLWLIALATAAGVLRTRVNPLWLLAGGAVLGGLLL